MKKKKNGFTLIELLAVIVILAIIALISTPIIIGVIEKARKGAFEDSAYGILEAGKTYYVDKLADTNKFEGATFPFPDGGDLKVSGSKPAGGSLFLDVEGKQAIAVWDTDKKWCAFKDYDEGKITIKDYKEEECKIVETLVNHIQKLNKAGNTEGLFKDDFGNIRYRGNNSVVKNYVTFNNEMWRIIGIFDRKVKLIKDDRILNSKDAGHSNLFLWNTANTNNWTASDLQAYLNNEYYDSLQDYAKNMVEETKYNLVGIPNTSIDKKAVYELERGTTVYSGRPTEWTGKIGLMHLSDYGYAVSEECTRALLNYDNEACKDSNWLYKSTYSEWTLTPLFSSSPDVAFVYERGYASSHNAGRDWLTVRPIMHLKSNIKISSGDGTVSNPYQLSY